MHVVIIGCGVIGAAAAWFLTRAGAEVKGDAHEEQASAGGVDEQVPHPGPPRRGGVSPPDES